MPTPQVENNMCESTDVNWFSEKHHHKSLPSEESLAKKKLRVFYDNPWSSCLTGMLLFYDDALVDLLGTIVEDLGEHNRVQKNKKWSARAAQFNTVCAEEGDKLPTFGLTPLRRALRSPIVIIIVLQNAIKYSELWSRWMITMRIVANKFLEFANTLESINNRPSKWNIINFIRVAIN